MGLGIDRFSSVGGVDALVAGLPRAMAAPRRQTHIKHPIGGQPDPWPCRAAEVSFVAAQGFLHTVAGRVQIPNLAFDSEIGADNRAAPAGCWSVRSRERSDYRQHDWLFARLDAGS